MWSHIKLKKYGLPKKVVMNLVAFSLSITLIATLGFLARLVRGNHEKSHPLDGRLQLWETISEDDLTIHRQRRSTGLKVPTIDKEVSFQAFNRQFRLSLLSSPEILAPDFRATVHGRHGEQKVLIDKSSLYTGTVLGEPGSEIRAHLEDKTLMATITTKNDTYIVEPSWRHLPEDNHVTTKKQKMIVYRQSDVNLTRLGDPHSNDGYCGVESLMEDIKKHLNEPTDNEDKHFDMNHASNHEKHRMKRAAGGRKKICTLALVADYRFYKEMGNSNHLQTMYYLINLVNRVNQIFKATNWDVDAGDGDEYIGYGFQISDITVFNESSEKPSFNADRDWTAKELLEAFSETNYKQCLAHLFTYMDFEKGVLGLAYVGAGRAEDVGGICTKPYHRGHNKPTQYLNTGLTTALNWGQRILTLEADLVTTHELGHNFGAEHDNGEMQQCSPGESNDGNFIMYPAAVSGSYPNNHLFSDCSKHNVFLCLKYKAPLCFHEDRKLFCGNYKVEEGEECDAGYIVDGVGEDSCCTRDCKLKGQAKCSNKNSVCCNASCQAASSDTLCYSEVPESCLKDTYCDGKNFVCPPHEHKDDNETCGDNGRCKAGICQPFCVTVGMKPCLCTDKKENFCLRCCAPVDTVGDEMIEKCQPYLNNSVTIELRNNAKCTLGYCANGDCIKQTQDVIERVWSIFENIAPDKIGEFLADNIVGAVLVFSLLFWVPCGCLVNFVDKQREKQRKKEDEMWINEFKSDYSRPNIHGGMFGSSTALHKIQKNNRGGVLTTKAGLNAKEQWLAAQERNLAAMRKSQEKLSSEETNGQASSAAGGDALERRNVIAAIMPHSDPLMNTHLKTNPIHHNGQNGEHGFPSRHVEDPGASSSRAIMPRPQLTRQKGAIEEEPDNLSP